MSWKKTSANGYLVATESDLVIPDSEGANIMIGYSSVINEDLSNKKFPLYSEITTAAGADVNMNVSLQGSLDGVTYVDLNVAILADIVTNALTKTLNVADTTKVYAPYYRFKCFTDGTNTVSAGAFKLSYSII